MQFVRVVLVFQVHFVKLHLHAQTLCAKMAEHVFNHLHQVPIYVYALQMYMEKIVNILSQLLLAARVI
jgi:hypothetical protein